MPLVYSNNTLEQRSFPPRRQRRRDARLKHRVTIDDAAEAGIECRAVERVSHLADQALGGPPRQTRVGIEDNDKADAGGHHRRAAADRDESGVGGAPQQAIELVQLAALAFPSDPLSLSRVPQPATMQQEEAIAPRARP